MRKKIVLLGLVMVILAIVLSIFMNISKAQDDDDNGDVPLNQTKTHQTTTPPSDMVYDIDKYNLKSDKDVVLLKKSSPGGGLFGFFMWLAIYGSNAPVVVFEV